MSVPGHLGIIAGRGDYPLRLAESAREQGVGRITVLAFRRETDPAVARWADEVVWFRLGKLQPLLDAIRSRGIPEVVMAGQIRPSALFTVLPDPAMRALLRRLRARNAETIFGAVAQELATAGATLRPASLFMEKWMPGPGQITPESPTPEQWEDIRLGWTVARANSNLDVGQTVVVKEGTVLAVEAFEGTDKAIRRAGRTGGPGAVIVKVAKDGHDMRFDIPVVGERTLASARKARAAVLAFEAGRTIVLDPDRLAAQAARQGLNLLGLDPAEMNHD